MSNDQVTEPPCFRCGGPTIAFDEGGRPLCSRHSMLFITAPRLLAGPPSSDADSDRGAPARYATVGTSVGKSRSWVGAEDSESDGLTVDLAMIADADQAERAAEPAASPRETPMAQVIPDPTDEAFAAARGATSIASEPVVEPERSDRTESALIHRGRPLPSQRRRRNRR